MELGGDYLFTHKSQTPVQQCELTANVILINCRVQIVVHYLLRVSGPSAVCVFLCDGVKRTMKRCALVFVRVMKKGLHCVVNIVIVWIYM